MVSLVGLKDEFKEFGKVVAIGVLAGPLRLQRVIAGHLLFTNIFHS